MQSTVIEIPLDHYDRFVDQCDQASPYYSTLKNGVIVRRRKEGRFERIVEIRCTIDEARALLDRAKRVYPAAAPYIEKAIAAARDS